jgi:hypothetical protein
MPFGSGKNNVYMFNPATSIFTLQVEGEDGKSRTIAQSLMTRDKDIKKDVSAVVKQMQQAGVKMSDVVSDDILQEERSYMSADNVEMAPNYKTPQYQELVRLVYADFFREYLRRYAEKDKLQTSVVPIGKGYSDALSTLPSIPNTFVPEAPVGYSDKYHGTVFALTPQGTIAPSMKQVTEREKPALPPTAPTEVRGVSALTFEDSLPVAYIEGKAYSDNQSLITYLHNMENALIAKDISNARKGRANMSFKYADEHGRVRGYLLAYEGKVTDNAVPERYRGQPVVYITDLASDRESTRAGGSLIKAFTKQYKREYLDKGNFVPLYMEAREQTSYKIISRQMERFAREAGMELEMEELPTYQAGKDTMHPVIIRVKAAKA